MKNKIAAAFTYFVGFFLWLIFVIPEISALRSHLIGEAKIGMVLYTAIGFLLVLIFFCIALTFQFQKNARWLFVGSFGIALLVLFLFYKALLYNANLVLNY